MDEGQPISYELLDSGVPVYSSDGQQVGTVGSVLSAQEKDIFHGLLIYDESRKPRFVEASAIAALHEHGVDLRIDAAAAGELPPPEGRAPVFSEDPREWAAGTTGCTSSAGERLETRELSTTGPGTVAAAFAARIAAEERELLSPLAERSYPARREHPEEDCSLRTPFQRDRDRIVHGKAFRRLTHKTQVFVAPRGDHYRTRLTHTLEVTTISRTVARALRLNEDLVEAIGLGHDLGHPPFGHIGEEALDALPERALRARLPPLRALVAGGRAPRARRARAQPDRAGARRDRPAFLQGAGAADAGGPDRAGDRPGRLHQPRHRRRGQGGDARRAGAAAGADRGARPYGLGADRRARPRHGRAVRPGGEIAQGPVPGPAMGELRDFMFERVYLGPAVREEYAKITEVIGRLFEHYVEHPELLPGPRRRGSEDLAQRVTDYLAGMTDRYAIRAYTDLQVPRAFAR